MMCISSTSGVQVLTDWSEYMNENVEKWGVGKMEVTVSVKAVV